LEEKAAQNDKRLTDFDSEEFRALLEKMGIGAQLKAEL